MKILILASYSDSLLNFRGDLISDLIGSGYEVIACAPNMSEDVEKGLLMYGATPRDIKLDRAGLNPVGDMSYFLSLCYVIKDVRPDLVLTYTVKPNIWGAFASKLFGVVSMSMITGLGYAFLSEGNGKQKLVGWVVKKLYRAATSCNSLVVFQNQDDFEDFCSVGALSEPKKARFVSGSGVNTARFPMSNLPNEAVFLLIARLLKSKGIIEYSLASELVRAEFPDARFILVGFQDKGQDGITQKDLDSLEKRGLEYIGELKDVRPAIADASVYVLPSYREGTPRSVLEAMSMGRPIITSDAPGCRETTIPGVNGFLVPVKEVSSLAEKMKLLAGDKLMREKYGVASRRLVEEKFSVEKVNRSIIGYVGELLNID